MTLRGTVSIRIGALSMVDDKQVLSGGPEALITYSKTLTNDNCR